MKKTIFLFALVFATCFVQLATAQKKKSINNQALDKINIDGLKWRNVGPALTSGRISDIAVNPNNISEYYVASASGGVWKTTNSGLTYNPIFDNEGSYSIGCVTMDPNNSNVIWVGTGENNNQRSVSYGDGIYKSIDGGQSWQHMGLKMSEHIGKIIVHPENSDIIFVAAIGPLWSKGGDRGLYKSVDGGKNWKAVLIIDEHTGVNDVVMDPRNPDVLYASTLQRRRHVYTYVGGGPESGMHKSTDGGETWTKIHKGLPNEELGRIGLSISSANPEIIYAIVEAANGRGGFYRSTNRGASWERRGNYVTSGNYYQEIFADPVDENTVYAMNNWMRVSHDGGRTFIIVGEDYKHIDNHAMWINPNNNKHWLVGCDGGVYETFDAAANWDFKENLPVTQFYKVALDNDKPFYNIYGGTQDNFSIGGPSRVLTDHGITNFDWFITHGGDGFESQVDPNNPNIVYAQSQYGSLVRFDKKSGEEVSIQPSERKNENAYRWNWDAPLAVSKHKNGRLYFAANKVFKSDDYGNSWQVISDDLTRQLDRNALKVYDRVVSINAVSKNDGVSPYGTIVALSESPINDNMLAIGTDDGLIHITENGGQSWRKIDNIPGAPKQSYVNNVYLSRHNVNVIYAAFNHHKYGDFKPYLFKSNDKGKTWTNISGNLPNRGSVYAIEEDHVDADLIFCGTEFGVFFSPNTGKRWKQFKNGLPTIAVRDIAIQERENDLVLGTFGRGFYVLDDYSSLRNIENTEPKENIIYPIREALMWEKSLPLGLPGKAFQGDNFYTADNLGPEALITYYYKDEYTSLEGERKKKEKKLIKELKDTPYPNYEQLKAENEEITHQLVFTIKNSNGVIVKKFVRTPSKGLQRFHWDLRHEQQTPIDLSTPSFYNPFSATREGSLVAPGTYTIEMHLFDGNTMTSLTATTKFNIRALDNTLMPSKNRDEKVAFQQKVEALMAEISECGAKLSDINNKMRYIREAIRRSNESYEILMTEVVKIEKKIDEVSTMLYGDSNKRRLDIDQPPGPASRVGNIVYGQKYSTAAPTKTHLDSYNIAKEEFEPIKKIVSQLYEIDIKQLEKKLKIAKAPYTPGRLKPKQ
ncbi:sialidase family protein [Pontimicrobium aquaticum]|uniref:Glycosyl hydrolase n=1 Tax=Pontimicrobium aquaticum TaxID=2565367 RepID=A0A4U0EYN6_9FLAO|nr:sialidase family protein [Pontimicrobium aquaticum]TJY37050.1 glycosyl hydrolase [Pontimicrobium aquaticum]